MEVAAKLSLCPSQIPRLAGVMCQGGDVDGVRVGNVFVKTMSSGRTFNFLLVLFFWRQPTILRFYAPHRQDFIVYTRPVTRAAFR